MSWFTAEILKGSNITQIRCKMVKNDFFFNRLHGTLKTVPNPPNLGLYPFPTDFEGGDRFLAKVIFFLQIFDFSVVDYSRNFSIFDIFLTFGKSSVKWSKINFFKIWAYNPLKTFQTPRNSIYTGFRPILKEEIGFWRRWNFEIWNFDFGRFWPQDHNEKSLMDKVPQKVQISISRENTSKGE